MEPILLTRGLSVGYGTTTLLRDMNLELRTGTLTSLLGRNGAGKSTLLRCLTRGDAPLAGSVTVSGKDISDYNAVTWSRTVAIVTTDRVGAGALTVSELVSLGRHPHTGVLGRLGAADRDVVAHAIDAVGMSHKRDSYVASLSDGERQKAMVARALAQQTPVIVLDEPTAFLDVASRIEMTQLLHTIAHESGKAVLLSTHDVSQALLLSDALWVITRDNRLVTGAASDVIAGGAMDEVFDNEAIRFNARRLDYEYRR